MAAPPARRRARHAPGPSALWCLRGTIAFVRDPLAYFLALQEDWGGIVRGRVGPFVFHTLFDPDLVREALVNHHECYTKRGIIDELIPLLGDGLLVSEGARWRGRRDGIAPLFARRSMADLLPALEREAEALVSRWRTERSAGREVDASAEGMHFAIAVIGRVLFGLDLGDRAGEISEAVETVADLALRRSSALLKLPLGAPTPVNRAYRGAIERLDAIVLEALRDDSGSGDRLLPRLRELIDPVTGAVLTERDLRDEAMSLLLAGHETTANTLAWALDHMGRDHALQDRLRDEVTGHAGADVSSESLGLTELPLLDAVVSETLRLAPPAWLMMRRSLVPHELGGYTVPRRSFLSIPVHAIHRNPDHWPEPERFLPARFLEQGAKNPTAFLPFGLGPRRCPGEFFARAETRILLSKLIESFRIETTSPRPSARPLATLRPSHHVRLRLR